MTPIQLKVVDKMYLSVKWSDGSDTKIKLANLRRNCPCAVCAAEREEQSASYLPIYTKEQLTISKLEIVGNYAVGVFWNDKHNTGIYDFRYLKTISEN